MLANDASLQVKSRSDPDVLLTYSVNHAGPPSGSGRVESLTTIEGSLKC